MLLTSLLESVLRNWDTKSDLNMECHCEVTRNAFTSHRFWSAPPGQKCRPCLILPWPLWAWVWARSTGWGIFPRSGGVNWMSYSWVVGKAIHLEVARESWTKEGKSHEIKGPGERRVINNPPQFNSYTQCCPSLAGHLTTPYLSTWPVIEEEMCVHVVMVTDWPRG